MGDLYSALIFVTLPDRAEVSLPDDLPDAALEALQRAIDRRRAEREAERLARMFGIKEGG